MSDLIDLTSPDSKRIREPKLSSPLIPLPEVNRTEACSTSLPMSLQKRRSSDDNPFDMELRKTNEYLNKREDPFEVVWEKALKADNTQVKPSKSMSIEFNDDSFYKTSRHSDVLKMNKTLPSPITKNKHLTSENTKSHIQQILTERGQQTNILHKHDNIPKLLVAPASPEFNDLSILSQSLLDDSFSVDCCPKVQKNVAQFKLPNPYKPSGSDYHDLSILNQSAMNDSLSASNSSDEGIKSLVAQRVAACIERGLKDAGVDSDDDRYLKLRRSFSQGDRLSPKNIKKNRSQSIIGSGKTGSFNNSSFFYEDPFNKGFIMGSINERSTIGDISAIKRLNSDASIYSARSSGSDGMANRGFIDSSTSERSLKTDSVFIVSIFFFYLILCLMQFN